VRPQFPAPRRDNHDFLGQRIARNAHPAAREPQLSPWAALDHPRTTAFNKVATEKNEVGVEGSSFSDDALEASNIVGMGAGMKIGKKKYSERMRPPRPTIDYEPQSANQMRTRPSNSLKPAFSAEVVAKGWPRNGADQAILQNLRKHISIRAIIPIRQTFGAHPFVDTEGMLARPKASPFTLDYATICLRT
jgi:hypothetical protein